MPVRCTGGLGGCIQVHVCDSEKISGTIFPRAFSKAYDAF